MVGSSVLFVPALSSMIRSFGIRSFCIWISGRGAAPSRKWRKAIAQTEYLPIYESAYDLCLWLQRVVRGFSRYHKDAIGSDLRDDSRSILCVDYFVENGHCLAKSAAGTAHQQIPVRWHGSKYDDGPILGPPVGLRGRGQNDVAFF